VGIADEIFKVMESKVKVTQGHP